MTGDPRLVVALDGSEEESRTLAESLLDSVEWVKVGMTLFYESGPAIVRELREAGFSVFLDLKLHDIPHQVRGAARTLARLGVGMMTVHASGGTEMIEAAVEGAREGAQESGVSAPAVLAVTVLTSIGDADLRELGIERSADEQVRMLATVAVKAGASGIVCSPREAAAMRALLGTDVLIVTPGVRPAGSGAGDQKRTATPSEALGAGASHVVIGRPITAAASPARAAADIATEMKGVRR